MAAKGGTLKELLRNRKSGGLLIPLWNEYLLSDEFNGSERRIDVFHPSEISYENFCPRAWCLRQLYPEDYKREFTAQQQLTFEIGKALHSMAEKHWSKMGILYGVYMCVHCEALHYGFRPTECRECGLKGFRYQEIACPDEDLLIAGHKDAEVMLGMQKFLVEFKTANEYNYGKVRSAQTPIEAHRRQSLIYFHCSEKNRQRRIEQMQAIGTPDALKAIETERLPYSGLLIMYLNKNSSLVS